tara:strand:- start:10323 stop:10439 length:117 start_codon:yes stop_codon:yes gene_type:complete
MELEKSCDDRLTVDRPTPRLTTLFDLGFTQQFLVLFFP